MKTKIAILLILAVSGCISNPFAAEEEEATVMDIVPVIDYYSLGGYTGGETGEAFYVIAGDIGEVREALNEIVVQGATADTTFAMDDELNLVVFRGVFHAGGRGIMIDRVERAGSAFTVYANYTDPGEGMMVAEAFTQPAATIPIGKLQKGKYKARLKVTTILKDEDGERTLEVDNEHASISFVVE